ncbi:4'-phosphopantetheinyl transferase HetI [Galdieria sulphuraria]|nr:4'-phosphopantetheinyl transferase HetI [Galdieria sulphuraria]
MDGGRDVNISQEVCQVCCLENSNNEAEPAKYRCPSCGTRTCSVLCVRKHKEQTGCEGKRQKSNFIPMTQYTEDTFLNDYTFLEEVHRASSSALVQLQRLKDDQKSSFHIQKKNKLLERKAKQSNVSVCFLPRVFTKAKLNESVYSFKNCCIFWSLRLVFPYLKLAWQLMRVNENEPLKELFERILQSVPPLSGNKNLSQLRQTYSKYKVEELQVYLVSDKRRAFDDNAFYKCDVTCSLKQILQGKVVVEFPTIAVLLPFEDLETTHNLH